MRPLLMLPAWLFVFALDRGSVLSICGEWSTLPHCVVYLFLIFSWWGCLREFCPLQSAGKSQDAQCTIIRGLCTHRVTQLPAIPKTAIPKDTHTHTGTQLGTYAHTHTSGIWLHSEAGTDAPAWNTLVEPSLQTKQVI
jgi:hypothetical protein